MYNLFLAGLGGFIGSVLRYVLNSFVYSLMEYPLFPLGILLINILGCFMIGLLGGLAEFRGIFTSEAKIFIFIGILGGFTTFSSFGYDTFNLWKNGQINLAFLNVFLHIILGLIGVWFGYFCARLLS